MPHMGIEFPATKGITLDADPLTSIGEFGLSAEGVGHQLVAEADTEKRLSSLPCRKQEIACRLHPGGFVINALFRPADQKTVETGDFWQRRTGGNGNYRQAVGRHRTGEPYPDRFACRRKIIELRVVAGEIENCRSCHAMDLSDAAGFKPGYL